MQIKDNNNRKCYKISQPYVTYHTVNAIVVIQFNAECNLQQPSYFSRADWLIFIINYAMCPRQIAYRREKILTKASFQVQLSAVKLLSF